MPLFATGFDLDQAIKDSEGGGGIFFKPKEGKNRFKILSTTNPDDVGIVCGYRYMKASTVEAGKREMVYLAEQPSGIPADALPDNYGDPSPKPFWCLCLYNFETNSPQIWEVTQKTIHKEIAEKAKMLEKLGATLLDFELVINRIEPAKGPTKYSLELGDRLTPNPAIDAQVAQYAIKPINIFSQSKDDLVLVKRDPNAAQPVMASAVQVAQVQAVAAQPAQPAQPVKKLSDTLNERLAESSAQGTLTDEYREKLMSWATGKLEVFSQEAVDGNGSQLIASIFDKYAAPAAAPEPVMATVGAVAANAPDPYDDIPF